MAVERADDDGRPDPDALLARVVAEERRATRARLKIYFGASPGVGKTFTMLEAAQRAKLDGVDVAVGVAETHGRAETAALLEGLTVIPRRSVEHRGVALEELDLEAALARHPELILVDELAHTNAPGSRHVKRWQDVLDLLDAGIDVWTTLNVQHVESLGDVIQQITGVAVRETVPDVVLERADELELVDLPPEELLERLAEGKVYVPEQIARATQNFFQRGNLLALRELALRRTAERVDADVLAYRREHGIDETWPTRDRILVCVGAGPGSERLIRATKRMAEGLRAPWSAAHVEVVGAPPLPARDRERLEAHLRLVEALGGQVVRLAGRTVASALLDHARTHNVTRLVAGKPTHARWRDLLRGGLVDKLIRGSGPIEVHVIAPLDEESPPPRTPARTRDPAAARGYASAAVIIAAVTAIGLLGYGHVEIADITMLYLIGISLASLAGRGPSVLAASLAVVAFDFCFVPPRFTFGVTDVGHLLTFGVMFGAGLAISTLTTRLRRQERDAIDREGRTATLLAFTREVATASTITDVAATTARDLEGALDVAAAVLVPDREEGLVPAAGLAPLAVQEAAVARWAFDHRTVAGHGTDTLPGARALCVPLVAGDSAVGVLAIQRRAGTPVRLGVDQRHLLDSIARQTALALARVMYAEQAREAERRARNEELRARSEELRSSLLSAVSHDLRTPLAVITGAATTLRDDAGRLAPAARADLLDTIVDDARRLERVLANLLQLTRVETGLEPARAWVPAEEVVGAALTRLEDELGDRDVELAIPGDLVLWIDPVLFEQVLINLLENALKHASPSIGPLGSSADGSSGPSPAFAIRAQRVGDRAILEVADRGPGLPADAGALFEKFARASAAPGVGLGLAVVRAIVEAHGGTITAANRTDGPGAVFAIDLPAPQPPSV
ncbi:MAG: sensor histidine kinase KdpD [Deltaproteobacteria bacterium]|nr:sensor histidine kinase KdpD [Deltaproteobacteria bacterium]